MKYISSGLCRWC